jgi:hypothetical protein
MGIPPTLEYKPLKEEDRIPIGTLVLEEICKEFYIVIGYESFVYKTGFMRDDWGYKEGHILYCQNDESFDVYDLSPYEETGYTPWKVVK